MARLILFCAVALFFGGCKTTIPYQPVDGFVEVQLGQHTLAFFGDYAFFDNTNKVYPPLEKKVFSAIDATHPDQVMCTNGAPYMGCMIIRTTAVYEPHAQLLASEEIRNLYFEQPSNPFVYSYANYGIDSKKYPVRYQFCEYLIQGDDYAGYRVIWWTTGSEENMKREAWKVMGTLSTSE